MKKPKPVSSAAPVAPRKKPGGFLLSEEIPKLSEIPSVLGGTSNELMIPRPVLHRVALLNKQTPEQIVEGLQMERGLQVTICDWPEGAPFFLVAGKTRHFPEDIPATCCNCQTDLIMSGDAPPNAVPICIRCVQYQVLLATTHGVTYH